jgi:hypothetical protein
MWREGGRRGWEGVCVRKEEGRGEGMLGATRSTLGGTDDACVVWEGREGGREGGKEGGRCGVRAGWGGRDLYVEGWREGARHSVAMKGGGTQGERDGGWQGAEGVRVHCGKGLGECMEPAIAFPSKSAIRSGLSPAICLFASVMRQSIDLLFHNMNSSLTHLASPSVLRLSYIS